MNIESHVAELKSRIREIKDSGADWDLSLTPRKKAELEFHNLHRDASAAAALPADTYEMLHSNKKFYLTTHASTSYVRAWIARMAKGKVFLDYACGNGANAMLAAEAGAALAIGLDISDVSVKNAENAAKRQGLGNAVFLQGDCEATGLPDESIDVVICSGMLHHLDLGCAFPELERILRPNGTILAVEALDYNPLIKLYRNLTPHLRTEWEKSHILSLRDVEAASRFFAVREIRYWHILSIAGAIFHRMPRLMGIFLNCVDPIDRFLTCIPFLQRMAWQFTFELHKRG